MKQMFLSLAVAACCFGACKSKPKNEPATTTTTTQTQPAPVEVSPDTKLQTDLATATKDFPGVTYTVANGEVTLTGTVERDRLPTLMQSVHALNPRKVNNQLTIK